MIYQRLFIEKKFMRTMHEPHHPFLSIILWFISGIMYFISIETMDTVYMWGFRMLSLISLFLIIGVNWKKGINGLKEMFSKPKPKGKKNKKK
jgi:hypothetical protein